MTVMKNGIRKVAVKPSRVPMASAEALMSKWPWSLGLLNSCLSKLIIGNKT